MKIVVAGAGIAGSVLTRMLRERGHSATLLDSSPDKAASRCAFAYLRTAWWTGEEKHRVREALKWYESHGWVIADEATVHDVRRGRVLTQRDHYLVDPWAPLLEPDLAMNLSGFSDGSAGVRLWSGAGEPQDADRLVLACGSGMERFTSGTATYGAVYEAPGRQADEALKLLRVTDRMTHVAAAGDRLTRVGASKGRTREAALARAEAILERMIRYGIVTPGADWKLREGMRWETLVGPVGGLRLDRHVWSFTGFARSGYATVPGAARDLVKELEQ